MDRLRGCPFAGTVGGGRGCAGAPNDEQVVGELVEGTAGDLPEAVQAWLSTLQVQRLTKRVRDAGGRPDGNPAPPGAREVRTGEHQNSLRPGVAAFLVIMS